VRYRLSAWRAMICVLYAFGFHLAEVLSEFELSPERVGPKRCHLTTILRTWAVVNGARHH
jgi:hypothetical protein